MIIDEIGIALGSGPDGYRATFRNIEAYGYYFNLSTQIVMANK